MAPPAQRLTTQPIPSRVQRQGFTLIELLVVITVIGILAAITLNIAGGVNQKAAMDKARAEIAAISNALEQFKSVRDYYPNNATTNAAPLIMTNSTNSIQPFYQATKYLTNGFGHLMDPYGNAYLYIDSGTNRHNPASFDVFSIGKDGDAYTADDIGNW
jgi:general secretion pathway protein G